VDGTNHNSSVTWIKGLILLLQSHLAEQHMSMWLLRKSADQKCVFTFWVDAIQYQLDR
jgi:hypothetical protein